MPGQGYPFGPAQLLPIPSSRTFPNEVHPAVKENMIIQFKERRDATKHVQDAPRELILCPGALWFRMIRKQLPLLRLN